MLENLNYTQIPNHVVDEWMNVMSGSAAKIFIAICRKTIGWHKLSDAISLSQLRKITGISSNNTLKKGIDELIDMELITKERGAGKTSVFDINIEAISNSEIAISLFDSTMSKTVHTKETLPKETSQKKLIYTDEFQTFWNQYPNNKGKREAFKCWLKLIKEGTTPEHLTGCAINYAAKTRTDKTEMSFILHASTFLGPNRRFEDFETAEQTSDIPSGYFVDKNDTAYQDGVKVGHYDGSRFIPSA